MSLDYNLDFIIDKSKKSNIKKAISILERAYYSHQETSSFFLDPFEQRVISQISEKNSIDILFIGGNQSSERKIFVANFYYEPLFEGNYLKILKFSGQNISHPDVLGALIHLGIDRSSIGDISILDDSIEFAVLYEDASLIKYNLTKIKREGITIEIKEDNHLNLKDLDYLEHSGFVSSLRIDNIVSLILNISRTKAKNIINSKLVKVDFQYITDPSFMLKEGSLISIRKEGRFIFDKINGLSKKGNYHIEYRKIVWFIY